MKLEGGHMFAMRTRGDRPGQGRNDAAAGRVMGRSVRARTARGAAGLVRDLVRLAGLVGLVGSALGVTLAAGGAHAELRRVEAVGIYGIKDSLRSRVIPKDEAIAQARWEGVSRVALELMGEAEPGEAEPTEDELAALEAALGQDTLPYTRSYRILKDQGERPVLFEDEPGINREYVVVVEVLVDVDRVGSALEQAGLIAASDAGATGEAVGLEILGLDRYEAFQTVVSALVEQLGARQVQTLAFERERQILSVAGPFGAEGLIARLARYRHPRLILEPMGVDRVTGRVRVMGRWGPAPEADDSAPPS